MAVWVPKALAVAHSATRSTTTAVEANEGTMRLFMITYLKRVVVSVVCCGPETGKRYMI